MCFCVADKASFENIEEVWLPELSEYVAKPTILLVGTKTDLRESSETPISKEQGEEKARKIGAIGYVECSSIQNINVKKVFDTAIGYAALGKTLNEDGGQCCNIF